MLNKRWNISVRVNVLCVTAHLSEHLGLAHCASINNWSDLVHCVVLIKFTNGWNHGAVTLISHLHPVSLFTVYSAR